MLEISINSPCFFQLLYFFSPPRESELPSDIRCLYTRIENQHKYKVLGFNTKTKIKVTFTKKKTEEEEETKKRMRERSDIKIRKYKVLHSSLSCTIYPVKFDNMHKNSSDKYATSETDFNEYSLYNISKFNYFH